MKLTDLSGQRPWSSPRPPLPGEENREERDHVDPKLRTAQRVAAASLGLLVYHFASVALQLRDERVVAFQRDLEKEVVRCLQSR